jgi:hypothetical protein
LHTAPEEMFTEERVEDLGDHMAEKLETLEELRPRNKDNLLVFLKRHIKKAEKGEPLRLLITFYGRGKSNVVWDVEWRNGKLGIIEQGVERLMFDGPMREKYASLRRHFDE